MLEVNSSDEQNASEWIVVVSKRRHPNSSTTSSVHDSSISRKGNLKGINRSISTQERGPKSTHPTNDKYLPTGKTYRETEETYGTRYIGPSEGRSTSTNVDEYNDFQTTHLLGSVEFSGSSMCELPQEFYDNTASGTTKYSTTQTEIGSPSSFKHVPQQTSSKQKLEQKKQTTVPLCFMPKHTKAPKLHSSLGSQYINDIASLFGISVTEFITLESFSQLPWSEPTRLEKSLAKNEGKFIAFPKFSSTSEGDIPIMLDGDYFGQARINEIMEEQMIPIGELLVSAGNGLFLFYGAASGRFFLASDQKLILVADDLNTLSTKGMDYNGTVLAETDFCCN